MHEPIGRVTIGHTADGHEIRNGVVQHCRCWERLQQRAHEQREEAGEPRE